MKFSVLMSLYSKENPLYLKESIESILVQTLLPNEIVIVKDGKLTKELEEVLKEYETNPLFKIVGFDENRGLGLALNYGINQCLYEVIARMDTDDICEKTRFFKQMKLIEEGYDLVGSNTIEFIDSINSVISIRKMPLTHEEILAYSKKRNPFIHPSVMFKKDLCLLSGSYRDFYLVEDYDMWVRMIQNGAKCINIDENLVFMRISTDFYQRRGGHIYYLSIKKFFKELRISKYISCFEYYKTILPRFVVYHIPNSLRKKFYKKKLRNSEGDIC